MKIQCAFLSKRKNSTKIPEKYISEFNVDLKEPTSLVTPTLLMSKSHWTHSYNYVYIPDFQRTYFVKDITYLNNDIMEVALNMDYLGSRRDVILNTVTFVERTNDTALYNDEVYDQYLSNTTEIVAQRSITTSFKSPFDTEGCYILRVVNNTANIGGISTYAITNDSKIADILNFLFTESNFKDVISDEVVKSFFNPFQYIISLKWIPLKRSEITASDSEEVYIGWWDTGIKAFPINVSGTQFDSEKINIPTNIYSDFRKNVSAFSEYYLYIPGVGNVSIGGADVNEPLYLSGSIDIVTGQCIYYLCEKNPYTSNADNNPIIATFSCNLATDIQLGQMGARLGGLIGNGIGAISSALSGNIGGMISGTVNAVQSVTNPTASINGTQGARFLIENGSNIIVSLTNYGSCVSPDTIGKPSYQNALLKSLLGYYVQCGNASIELQGYDDEADIINGYLNGGVYLE